MSKLHAWRALLQLVWIRAWWMQRLVHRWCQTLWQTATTKQHPPLQWRPFLLASSCAQSFVGFTGPAIARCRLVSISLTSNSLDLASLTRPGTRRHVRTVSNGSCRITTRQLARVPLPRLLRRIRHEPHLSPMCFRVKRFAFTVSAKFFVCLRAGPIFTIA